MPVSNQDLLEAWQTVLKSRPTGIGEEATPVAALATLTRRATRNT